MYNAILSENMSPSLQDRLAAHRLLVGAPPDQIAWLAARGYIVTLEPGGFLATKGSVVLGLYVILSGHLTIHVDRGAGPQRSWSGTAAT